ncbi:unnamed protein product [Allacma fusca]|uniref:Retrotransposon gag domain-containing protein n=1 Tax=Allacma fusca TaxID=39272 RepID=A0A8J2KU07_9HEXA|nr:unnamed protein product [Allacma fusca]
MFSFTDFHGFTTYFRREFQSGNYAQKMLRELDSRYQGLEEPLSKFICIIDDFYERIDPSIPESTRIGKIMELMHPHYRAKVMSFRRSFSQIRELMEVAYEAQNSVALDMEYREPNLDTGLEPSLSYRESKVSESSFGKNVPEIQKSSFDQYGSFHPKPFNKSKPSDNDNNWRKSNGGTKGNFPRSDSPHPRGRDRGHNAGNNNRENSQTRGSNSGSNFHERTPSNERSRDTISNAQIERIHSSERSNSDRGRPLGQASYSGNNSNGTRSREGSSERRVQFSGNGPALNH